MVTGLQKAIESGHYQDYLAYADQVNNRPITNLRDLMQLKLSKNPLDIKRIESKNQIFKRFDSAAMSIGALSPEAHQALSVAMNRIGARSNSGEGGEDPSRFWYR
ncbi:MAG: glutamate synthase-related protein [Enterobacterales bacterium]|nr:glutamate synthase-related protein [Enterobacterales bacterium]